MTAAEEHVLRSAVNPWPLSLRRIAETAERSQGTSRDCLLRLSRHGLVREVYAHAGAQRTWMVTDAGVDAISNIDAMRVA